MLLAQCASCVSVPRVGQFSSRTLEVAVRPVPSDTEHQVPVLPAIRTTTDRCFVDNNVHAIVACSRLSDVQKELQLSFVCS